MDGDVFSILPLTFLCAVCFVELPLDGDFFSLSSITCSILPLNVPCAICFVELSLDEDFLVFHHLLHPPTECALCSLFCLLKEEKAVYSAL